MRLTRATAKAAVLALAGLVNAFPQRPALDYCPNPEIFEIQPVEYEYQVPILVSTYVPVNTDIVINSDLVIHVTNAPRTISTVVTDTSVTVLTLSR